MKKIDKLVLDAFAGPFLITFLVVLFILLNVNMIKYFDDIIGKGLEWTVIGKLFFYFGVITTPTALPLAILLSSLIAYGNLGEHFELTAIKGAGISLVRTIQPIFIFVSIITVLAFFANNYLVPKAALEAYSLLWDIKEKKPALDIKEGAFYGGIPGISIRANKKFPDGETIRDVTIYDHRKNRANTDVTRADSGRMYTILNERYLKIELFNGYNYSEGITKESSMIGNQGKSSETLSRSKFDQTHVVFDLSSFDLKETDKKWFQGNRIMRNTAQLQSDLDSMRREVLTKKLGHINNRPSIFYFMEKGDSVYVPPYLQVHQKWLDSMNQVQEARLKRVREVQDSIKAVREKEKAKKKKEEKNDSVTIPSSGSSKSASKTTPEKNLAPKKSPGTPSRKPPFVNGKKQRPTKNRTISPRHDAIPGKDSKALPARKPKTSEEKIKEEKEAYKEDHQGYNALVSRRIDSIYELSPRSAIFQQAANRVRSVVNHIKTNQAEIESFRKQVIIFDIQWHKIIANACACLAMLMIGAPLGAIIKKGGLGVPFLVSIFFFIIYYVLSIQGEKLAKQETLSAGWGVWMPDMILFLIGVFFLGQARADARLFEMDAYLVFFEKTFRRLKASKSA